MARGKLMSHELSPSSGAPYSATAIEARVRAKLSRMDGVQLQIVEIVIAAIERGLIGHE
jgi:hypothetical protein